MNIGVHTSHCCKHHGCKYGEDETCPVVLGDAEGNAGCEYCADFLGFEDAHAKTEAHVDWVRDGDEVIKESARTDGTGRGFE